MFVDGIEFVNTVKNDKVSVYTDAAQFVRLCQFGDAWNASLGKHVQADGSSRYTTAAGALAALQSRASDVLSGMEDKQAENMQIAALSMLDVSSMSFEYDGHGRVTIGPMSFAFKGSTLPMYRANKGKDEVSEFWEYSMTPEIAVVLLRDPETDEWAAQVLGAVVQHGPGASPVAMLCEAFKEAAASLQQDIEAVQAAIDYLKAACELLGGCSV